MDVSSLLASLSAVDAAQRTAAEAQLAAALKEHPAQLFIALLTAPSLLALVLVRRLVPPVFPALPRATQDELKQLLLQALISVDTHSANALVDVLALDVFHPWPQLVQTVALALAAPNPVHRQAGFRIYKELPALLTSQQPLLQGLQDDAPQVRLASLDAAVSFLTTVDTAQLKNHTALLPPMLELLPYFVQSQDSAQLSSALIALITLCSTPRLPARLLKPYLPTLTSFCLSLLSASPCATSPTYSATAYDEEVRFAALEVLNSIAEMAPAMTRAYAPFATGLIDVLLDIMGERDEDDEWVLRQGEGEDGDDDEGAAIIAEGALDRLSQNLGPAIFAPTLQKVQQLLASPQWQHRHAALSAIASIAEGCGEVTKENMRGLLTVVLGAMKDPHPRVRYAAIYAIGQLCTDGEGVLQEEYGREVLEALVGVICSVEPRLQAYTCSCLVNFFQTCDVEPLLPILPQVFEQLVRLLSEGKLFVKEHALEAISILAGSMGTEFSPLYGQIMQNLLSVLESGSGEDLMSLRAKALDCASTIAEAVETSVFEPDAIRLLTAMHSIQSSITAEDEITLPYLLRSYAQLSSTVGANTFAPYIANVLPHLVAQATRKNEVRTEEQGEEDGDDEWETVEVEGKLVGIKTEAMEEKLEAVGNLVILVQALGSTLEVERLQGLLEVGVPLLEFWWHTGVRDAAAALVAVTLQGLSQTLLPRDTLAVIFNKISDSITISLAGDADGDVCSVFLTSWISCYSIFPESVLSLEGRGMFLRALEEQLLLLKTRENERTSQVEDEDDRLEWDDSTEWDAQIYSSIGRALGAIIAREKEDFPVQRFTPFLVGLVRGGSGSKAFAGRLCYEIIAHMGSKAAGLVAPVLRGIGAMLTDQDTDTRILGASIIGIAASTSPAAFAPACLASVEPLFATVGPIEMEDNQLLLARDAAIGAIARIITSFGDQLNLDTLLPRWVGTLPVLLDGTEFAPCCTLLLELLSRDHPSVSPQGAAAGHILKVLVSLLQSDVLPERLRTPLCDALRAFVQRMDGAETVWQSLPEDVRSGSEGK